MSVGMNLKRQPYSPTLCRTIFGALFVLLFSHTTANAQEHPARDWQRRGSAKAVKLVPYGKPRKLPERILGASVEPFWSDVTEDPEKIALLKRMNIGFLRFPGGSQSNYYKWRPGLCYIQSYPNGSDFAKFWYQSLPSIRRHYPQGYTIDNYLKFADQIFADVVLVPNLETDTPESQAAWFKKMREAGSLPSHIEMGNEFWAALGMDPHVLKVWPDEATAMRRVYEFYKAIKPYLQADSKVAGAQAAAGLFHLPTRNQSNQHKLQWDRSLSSAPWFDAVTVHLYPRLFEALGKQSRTAPPAVIFSAMLGRCDGGVDRMLKFIEQKCPGKEIWVTEWSTRGVDHEKESPLTGNMRALLAAKMTMAYLRHPSVTMSIFFQMSFAENKRVFVRTASGAWRPSTLVTVLTWLNQAANGGVRYQHLTEEGGKRLPGGGPVAEDYAPVEAGLFNAEREETLIIENASNQTRKLSLEGYGSGAPAVAQTLPLGILDTADIVPPVPAEIHMGVLVIPPYSLSRVRWDKQSAK